MTNGWPMWTNKGIQRPPFAEQPSEGRESVWDYPRPPKLLADGRLVEISSGEHLIARSDNHYRICETASPPSFYIPPDQIDWSLLKTIDGGSYCEWKGLAKYWCLKTDLSLPVAWSYPKPRALFIRLANFVSFYPGRLSCTVDKEKVRAQPGGFYGGWITNEIVGPFKGEPGTGHW
jgi:uncharacterized protein (DUF427 family)